MAQSERKRERRTEPRRGTTYAGRMIVLNDQGGAVMQVTVDMTATLRAQEHGHPPIVFESHGQDARYRELPEVCETISAKYGLGGGNAPIVVEYAETVQPSETRPMAER